MTLTLQRRSAVDHRAAHPLSVANVPVQAVPDYDLVEVGQNLPAGRDPQSAPRLELIAVGEEIAVGANARVRCVQQAPPRLSWASSMTKLRPGNRSCRWCAAPMPETPAPTMRTSTSRTSWAFTGATRV